MAKVQPLGDRVLVKSIEQEEVTVGGIILPDSAKEKPLESEVVTLGSGGVDKDGNSIEFHVAEGDIVLTSPYGGTPVKYDGVEYKIFSQSDIIAVIK